MSLTTNNLGYRRKPIAASSLDVGSLTQFSNWQMSVYAPSSIPKPPSNSYTAFFDSTNSNKLSVKDSTGTVALVGGSGGANANGNFQALVGPTETYTSVQAAVTAGFWRLRITGTFTEPGVISFAALSLNPDILISIDQGVTWTTANIITYTGGGNITFTGGGTFKYTVGGTGVIVLTAGKRVTFNECNVTNAASVNTCRLALSTIEVFIMNSTITVPNQNDCLINSSAYVYIYGCTIIGGGVNMYNCIIMAAGQIGNIYSASLTSASNIVFDFTNVGCSNIQVPVEMRFTTCTVSNIYCTANAQCTISDCIANNIYFTLGTLTITSGSRVCNGSFTQLVSSSSSGVTILTNVDVSGTCNLGTTPSFTSLINCRFTGATITFQATQRFSNCTLGSGSSITIGVGPIDFTDCTFNGNTTLGSTANVHLTNCKVTGTLTVGSGSNHKVENTETTSSIAVTGSQAQITNTRCTSMTVDATQCSISGCILSSTLLIGSSASAQGSVFSNNIVTSTTDTSANTNSDDLIFTGNNLIGTVTVPAGATANHQPLFTGNKIGAGGVTATGPTNSHANSGNNSRP